MLEPRPSHFKGAAHEVALISIVSLGMFLCQGGITMSLSTMNVVLKSFEGNGSDSSIQVWFMGSFALTVGTFILVSGRLGDLFGLKNVFLVGWFWIFVWSLITGLSVYSNSVIFYIICRAFQGIGFALLLPCGMGILGSIYPNGERKNVAFGCVGASAPVGATVGAIMAAVLAQLAWWPWAFWILAIVCFVLGIMSIFYVPPNLNARKYTWREAWEHFDAVGSLVGIVGLILFNFVWNQGPVVGWDSAYIIVLLIISVLSIVAFFIIEKKVKHPLLPASIFNIRIGLVLLCVSLGWGSFGIWQYYYWHIILNLRHYTPIEASATYVPLLILGIIASFSVSAIISRTKPSYIISFSIIGFLCGCIMLSVMPVDQTYFRIAMGQMFLLCWGMDMSFPAAAIVLSNYLPRHHQGMAGSLVSTVVNYSVSIILAMGATVEIEIGKNLDLSKPENVLSSYRAAIYFGTGVAALGVLVSFVFIAFQTNDEAGTFEETEVAESKNEYIISPACDQSSSKSNSI